MRISPVKKTCFQISRRITVRHVYLPFTRDVIIIYFTIYGNLKINCGDYYFNIREAKQVIGVVSLVWKKIRIIRSKYRTLVSFTSNAADAMDTKEKYDEVTAAVTATFRFRGKYFESTSLADRIPISIDTKEKYTRELSD